MSMICKETNQGCLTLFIKFMFGLLTRNLLYIKQTVTSAKLRSMSLFTPYAMLMGRL